MTKSNSTQYWLFKSEPNTFSFDDLKNRPNKTEPWDGVRNYQARNFLRDSVRVGDLVLFYHSSCKTPGIVGIAQVSKAAYPDPTAFDKKSPYFDPKSTPNDPRWFLVDIKYKSTFKDPISLEQIKADPKLQSMKVAQRGQRLSIQPVEKTHFDHILKLAEH